MWFDFFSDDVIVPRLNNLPANDVEAYKTSFEALLKFIKPYQPKNLNMTLSRVIDQYDSPEDFEREFSKQTELLTDKLGGNLPEMDEAAKATVELNVKATPQQKQDPQWREKVQFIHDSYAAVSKRRPYYRPLKMHKIMVVTTPLWGMLTVGSTKDSTMKFWVGAGVLKTRENSFRQVILSPAQLQKIAYQTETTSLDGLRGKNFGRIRVTSD